MTKEEILAMEAGEELDKVVHEMVMELCVHEWEVAEISKRRHFVTGGACKRCGVSPLFAYSKYSTDISAAWQVKEKMREELFSVRWRFLGLLEELSGNDDIGGGVVWPSVFWFITPETICKAALLAKLE